MYGWLIRKCLRSYICKATCSVQSCCLWAGLWDTTKLEGVGVSKLHSSASKTNHMFLLH